MKKIDLGQTINTIANVGVIVGILFLAYEIRQIIVATNISAADFYIASFNDVNDLVVETPGMVSLVIKAQEGQALSSEEELRLNLMWGNALRNWQRAYYLHEQGVLDEIFWHTHLGDMQSALEVNRHLQKYWEVRRDRFDSGFNQILDGLLANKRSE